MIFDLTITDKVNGESIDITVETEEIIKGKVIKDSLGRYLLERKGKIINMEDIPIKIRLFVLLNMLSKNNKLLPKRCLVINLSEFRMG